MELVVLGSGTAVPHPRRSSAAFWLQTASASVLLDISAPALHRMAQEKLPWAHLDAIWVSHFHLDHCGGLAPFLFATRGAPEAKNRTKPLRIFGASGLRNLIETLDGLSKKKLLDQPFPVEIIEIEPLERFELISNLDDLLVYARAPVDAG